MGQHNDLRASRQTNPAAANSYQPTQGVETVQSRAAGSSAPGQASKGEAVPWYKRLARLIPFVGDKNEGDSEPEEEDEI